MRTGIFGGSFNPVHRGHRHMAEALFDALALDRMLVIPAYVSPFKEVSDTPPACRLAMCRLAFPEERFLVSDIELQSAGCSYTYNTVCALREEYPQDEFFLCVGSDMLLSFDRWHRYRELLGMVCLAAVSRCAEDEVRELEDFADRYLRCYGKVQIVPFAPLEISSTVVRRTLAEGGDTDAWLEANVKQYILQNNLYKRTTP